MTFELMYAAIRTNTGISQLFSKAKRFGFRIAPVKNSFAKRAEEERRLLEDCIPKSTRASTKWASNIFNECKFRANKVSSLESCSFTFDMAKILRLDTNVVS